MHSGIGNLGTECVSEPFVGCLDLAYVRNAGFNPDMETYTYVRDLTWRPDGRMEVVPLFPYVYHEHGPVAIQGIRVRAKVALRWLSSR